MPAEEADTRRGFDLLQVALSQKENREYWTGYTECAKDFEKV